MPRKPINVSRKRQKDSGSTYQPTEIEDALQLQNPIPQTAQGNPTQQQLEDKKVIHYLSKIHARQVITLVDKFVRLTILICTSEATYFETNKETLLESLRSNFGIKDMSISPDHPGSVDRYLSLYGTAEPIAKAMVYLIFILNTKLNNIAGIDLFTLKSSNYKTTLLLKTSVEIQNKHGLKYLDTSSSFTYNFKQNVHSVFAQGDLHSLHNTYLLSLELNLSCDDNDLTNMQSFGIHLDPALYKRSEENTELLTKSTQKVLEFIYPTSRFN
ncbi:uncharacterized protein J8A68_000630 [[Candida] subhashii]|uniref:Uncharacterized protein n=1 Tax=[Candida] subhashii TaxID=561895 RepID=A0A8J5QVA9_9ASCO|nr:uncharacterized protein J8A68_000630 [[Candida] subhashii]KAG7665805.1 hypothetical protein J8A68_000630 [[Candida] subhashii]